MSSRFDRMISWFMPTDVSGISDSQIEDMRALAIFAFSAILVIVPYLIFYLIFGMIYGTIASIYCIVTIASSLWVLKNRADLELAVKCFVIAICQMIVITIWVTGGDNSPLLPWAAALPFVGSLVHSVKMAYKIATFLSVVFAVVYSSSDFIYFPYDLSFMAKQLSYLSFCMEFFVLSFFTSIFIEKSKNIVQVINEENETLKRILENVRTGFLVINREGIIQPGSSFATKKLFGRDVTGIGLASLLVKEESQKEHLAYSWQQIFDDTLPEKVSLMQVNPHYRYNNKILALEGAVLRNGSHQVSGVLYTISDATALMEIESENQNNSVLLLILGEKEAFSGFLDSAKELLTRASYALQKADLDTFSAALHTLKGNAAVFGLNATSELIHLIESYEKHSQSDIDAIHGSINAFIEKNRNIIDMNFEDRKENISLDKQMIAKLRLLGEVKEKENFNTALNHWSQECRRRLMIDLLRPYKTLVASLAAEYKKPTKLNIRTDDARVSLGVWGKLSQHIPSLLRNSFYHGIENPRERGAKPMEALIEFAASVIGDVMHFEVGDDGRGIDPAVIRDLLLNNKLIHKEQLDKMSDHQIIQEIFRIGFSTAAEADMVAGRGLGVFALQASVLELGGTIEVFSRLGQGTRFVIKLKNW